MQQILNPRSSKFGDTAKACGETGKVDGTYSTGVVVVWEDGEIAEYTWAQIAGFEMTFWR